MVRAGSLYLPGRRFKPDFAHSHSIHKVLGAKALVIGYSTWWMRSSSYHIQCCLHESVWDRSRTIQIDPRQSLFQKRLRASVREGAVAVKEDCL